MKEKELIAIMASNLYHGIPYNGYSNQVVDAIRLAIWILEEIPDGPNEDGVVVPFLPDDPED